MFKYLNGKKIIIILLFVFIVTSGLGCKKDSSITPEMTKPITLEYWRAFDSSGDFQKIIDSYRALHPHISINYKKLRPEDYDKEIVNAMAEDRGPDIFSTRNIGVRGYKTKLAPLPDQISLVYQEAQGTLKKEIAQILKTSKTLSLKDLKNLFVDVVYDDVVLPEVDKDGKQTGRQVIYGLPLSVDTLALFYNRDLLNNAGISNPPKNWDEFKEAVKKMTKFNSKGVISQSGAAIGTAYNIPRSPDLISLLFMQNGTQMVGDNGFAAFNQMPSNLSAKGFLPADEALRFYTDFSSTTTEVYTWNNQMKNDQNVFIEGRLGFLFSYSYLIPILKAQAPKLNFAVASVPQIQSDRSFNVANYWVEVVSKKSKHINEAWDFIQFMTRAENAINYLDSAKRPTALKALVDKQKEQEGIDIFAGQLLTAKSWYRGQNPQVMEVTLREMIDNTRDPKFKNIVEVLNFAASKVNQTIDR